MACGEIGLPLDDFYNLTMRQFSNICIGHFRAKKAENESYLLGVRKIMWAALRPYSTKSDFSETDLFKFDFENSNVKIDLEKEIEKVEKQKEYWAKVDRLRKERNGSSAD